MCCLLTTVHHNYYRDMIYWHLGDYLGFTLTYRLSIKYNDNAKAAVSKIFSSRLHVGLTKESHQCPESDVQKCTKPIPMLGTFTYDHANRNNRILWRSKMLGFMIWHNTHLIVYVLCKHKLIKNLSIQSLTFSRVQVEENDNVYGHLTFPQFLPLCV